MQQLSTDLLADLADGNARAWRAVVDRHTGLIWSVAHSYGLSASDTADVVQTTWLRLLEHARSLRDADHLRAWLAVTARHEAIQVLRRASRSTLVDDDSRLESSAEDVPVDEPMLRSERDATLREACETLPSRCRRLLPLLFADPPVSYAEIAAVLAIPMGSIGPTRARCLACLRHRKEVQQALAA